MTQDASNEVLARTELIQIDANATPEAMSAIPFQSDQFYDWTDDSLAQFVEVHGLSSAGVEHYS